MWMVHESPLWSYKYRLYMQNPHLANSCDKCRWLEKVGACEERNPARDYIYTKSRTEGECRVCLTPLTKGLVYSCGMCDQEIHLHCQNKFIIKKCPVCMVEMYFM